MNEIDRRNAIGKVLERERWYRERRAEARDQEPMRKARHFLPSKALPP